MHPDQVAGRVAEHVGQRTVDLEVRPGVRRVEARDDHADRRVVERHPEPRLAVGERALRGVTVRLVPPRDDEQVPDPAGPHVEVAERPRARVGRRDAVEHHGLPVVEGPGVALVELWHPGPPELLAQALADRLPAALGGEVVVDDPEVAQGAVRREDGLGHDRRVEEVVEHVAEPRAVGRERLLRGQPHRDVAPAEQQVVVQAHDAHVDEPFGPAAAGHRDRVECQRLAARVHLEQPIEARRGRRIDPLPEQGAHRGAPLGCCEVDVDQHEVDDVAGRVTHRLGDHRGVDEAVERRLHPGGQAPRPSAFAHAHLRVPPSGGRRTVAHLTGSYRHAARWA